MSHPGVRGAVVATSPLAVTVPAPGGAPVLLDIAIGAHKSLPRTGEEDKPGAAVPETAAPETAAPEIAGPARA
jgi:ureidoglycolate dehydrogenase (NAD+)